MNTTTATTETTPVKTVLCGGGCGRKLTNPDSIARGFGPVCWKRVRAQVVALPAIYTDAQVEAAAEAIEDGAVVPSCRPLLFFVVSTNGRDTHLVNLIEDTCTCDAGRNDRACYHLAAAQVIDRAQARAAA